MWNQEVLEIFIADSIQDPTHYHEVPTLPLLPRTHLTSDHIM